MSIDLVRTPAGWTYPDPGPCTCGESAATVGWAFCRCAGAAGGGHPSWRCRACAEVRTLGCVGRIEVPNEYGGRRQTRTTDSHAYDIQTIGDRELESLCRTRSPA